MLSYPRNASRPNPREQWYIAGRQFRRFKQLPRQTAGLTNISWSLVTNS